MNKALTAKLQSMSADEIYAAVYSDALTGIQNRRAWDELCASPAHPCCMAIVDLDSLKFLNDNIGHAEGNAYLQRLATLLASTFGEDNVARLGGDEFGVLGDNPKKLWGNLNNIRVLFPCFSYGIGDSIEEADAALIVSKNERERTGERAKRGECPPWLGNVLHREAC